MANRRTFYLVPADVVAQPTIAVPRPLAPSPRVISTVPLLQKSPGSLKRPLSADLKRPLSADLKRPFVADPIEVLLGENTQPHQRKRECLDHLTHEQKMNRRKMKNRIAAQTARDRKKYRSQRLEDVIRELLEQNEILKQENELLQAENRELTEQNRSLMSRLEGTSDEVTCTTQESKPVVYEEVPYEMISEKSGATLESAAFISGLLPRVQNLEFDLDQLVEQLPEEEQHSVQPTACTELCQPASSSPEVVLPGDESVLSVPRCSPPSACYPSPSNYSSQLDELSLFEDQKLLDDPMLSSPSNWLNDAPHALSPFSDSFQREFFQMLE